MRSGRGYCEVECQYTRRPLILISKPEIIGGGMQAKFVILPALGLIANSFVSGQPAQQRWAIIAAHGPAANSNPGIANAEARVTDDLTAQLTGLPGVALIDRASIDKVLKEQNFQNSDRSSADTAVRIGKLLGVGQMVLVQVFDYSYTTHPDQ